MKKIILDTNCYSAYLAGDENVLESLIAAETVFMSVFVLGELFAGFKGGSREAANLSLLARFLHKPGVQVLHATDETAEIFGQLKAALKKAETPLPINDVWIAAHAMETGSAIVTYDSHFNRITGLQLWLPSLHDPE
ncbi:MAG: type II toxin-antitoxin system VapC family toxin [Desulfurivibrio sp.]|nr:MAG: type II toxin-antitoxin system VapC family toxin [Desulfurivibrio sp.]